MTCPLTSTDYYFGCEAKDSVGHFLFAYEPGSSGKYPMRSVGRDYGFPPQTLDGKWCPQISSEPEYLANITHFGGWTIMAFWDRSGDSRPGSNSAFIMWGILSFDEAVARAKARFPKVWSRFTAEVKEWR